MLDWGHRLVLRSVANGAHTRPSPALDNLIATGLVARTEHGTEVTEAGRVALAATKTTRLERIGWPVVWVCLFVVALASVIELLS
jgi:ribosomal protein S19E (S16A)